MIDDRAGALFTDVYVAKGPPLRDDPRMRRRLAALLVTLARTYKFDFKGAITGRLGIDVPYSGYDWDWVGFFARASLEDMLNSVTVIHNAFLAGGSTVGASLWRNGVSKILDEQNASYRIEAGGGVRFRADAAMATTTLSAIGVLNDLKLMHIAGLVDDAMRQLDNSRSDYAEGIRKIFFAAEELFKLNFPGAQRLVGFEIEGRLLPAALALSEGNKAALDATPKLIAAFKDWVAGCHDYRHAKGDAEPKQPPEGLGLAMIAFGISWIRWLAPIKGSA